MEDLRDVSLQSPACPLCKLQEKSDEKIYYEDNEIVIVDAKTKKGHAKRIMLVLRNHISDIPEEYQKKLIQKFAEIVMPEFSGNEEFYIYGTMQTIKDHWHKICCLKDEKAEDFEVLFGSPRDDLIRVSVVKSLA